MFHVRWNCLYRHSRFASDSMPPTPTYSPPPTPSYIIPASLLKSNATRARRSSSSYSSIPKSSPPRYCPEYDARDDIFGGF